MSEASWADALCKVIAERDALAKQLATTREDALIEALATIAGLKAWPNSLYDAPAIMCGHEEAYRAIEKRIKEKTK